MRRLQLLAVCIICHVLNSRCTDFLPCYRLQSLVDVFECVSEYSWHQHHHHHHVRVASEGLQRSPIGRVESFRSWSSHLFCGRPGGRRHVRSGDRLSDTGVKGHVLNYHPVNGNRK